MTINRDSVRSARLRAFLACLTVGLAVSAADASAAWTPPFETGFNQSPGTAFEGTQAPSGFSRVADTGATVLKLYLDWRVVAGEVRPENPADPADPAYDWTVFDELMRNTVAAGLKPLVRIANAPDWGTTPRNPSTPPEVIWTHPFPVELGLFAKAAATRYNGDFDPDPGDPYAETLPRARLWQIWNEPNQYRFLYPQRVNGQPVGITHYRSMVNQVAAGVKSVSTANLVFAGGTSPFKKVQNTAPLEFLRILVCLNTNLTPKKNCGPVRFDLWGTHPYTSGNPTRKAAQKGDVSIGDLPAVRKLLNAGLKHRKITAAGGKVKFWVDEFSWDTKPPDPAAIPAALHKRWVAEGMYRMWTAGVTMVAWLQLADNKYTGACGDPYQSGFYYFNSNIAQAKVKPSIVAFRFPFVAIPERTSLRIWGRTRTSDPGKVVIQRRTSSGWRNIANVTAHSNGIFASRFKTPWTSGWMRAVFKGKASPAFEIKRSVDQFYNPFGQRPPAGGCS